MLDVLGYVAEAPGYGFLPNETAPPSRLILSHFDIKAGADSIEFNYPDVAGKNHVITGGLIHSGEGTTGSNSGISAGFAHVDGFAVANILSRYSRNDAIHVEDGSRFGVLTGIVARDCQDRGFYGAVGGYGGNAADATPIVHVGFAYEFGGDPAATSCGIENVWDPQGYTDHWVHANGYIRGFNSGVSMGGYGTHVIDNVVLEGCADAVLAAGRPVHRGHILARGCDNLIAALSNDARPQIDRVSMIDAHPASGSIFKFPSTENK